MTDQSQGAANAHRYRVQVVRNGPYLVSGGVPLSEQSIDVDADGECHGWRQGEMYPPREKYALCRCGQTETPPFCDGTHSRTAFDGTETCSRLSYLEQAAEINGPDLRLTDAAGYCAEARFCHRAGGIWTLVKESGKAEARQKAVEEAGDCPSGRLVVWDRGGKPIEPDFVPSIVLVDDAPAGKMGPVWVRGHISIESEDGTVCEPRNRVTLCRCGKSANKPFCDGRHLE